MINKKLQANSVGLPRIGASRTRLPDLRALMTMLTLAFLLSGCDQLRSQNSTIGEISRSPAAFEGREVSVRGTVVEQWKIPLIEVRGYLLRDATGDLPVMTLNTLPGTGEEVVVKGRVESMAIVAGQGYGTALKELERRPPGISWPWK